MPSVTTPPLTIMSPFSIPWSNNFYGYIERPGSHNLIRVSTTQKSKGTSEKKTKRKSDQFDEEIASDSDEEWVESLQQVYMY